MDVAANPTYPREGGTPVAQMPLQNQGPSPFYPPMCIQTHWDPTAILRHTLPTVYVPQALDPRPWSKVCLQYVTAGDTAPAPTVSPNTMLPTGGQFYPTSRYASAIDNESKLRGLDRPLGTCEADQYEPNERGDMYDQSVIVPGGAANLEQRLENIQYPKTLLTAGPYPCRFENDKSNFARSDRAFNNTTKQDRYKLLGKV